MTVVVVGSGQAGARAVEALRQNGYRGRVVLVGEEPYLPYDRPPLSKDVLLKQGGQYSQEGDLVPVLDPDFYRARAIELRLGVRVVRIRRDDRAVDLADGSSLGYERLILATGLRSRPLKGFELDDLLHHLRTLDDALRLRQALRPGLRLLVVGGGLLGLEIAATARRIGCEVTVVERHPSLLYQSVAAVVGDHVTRLHHRHGVHILTGVTPCGMRVQTTDPQSGARAIVTDLSNGETLVSDRVVAATGSLVNTELAEACGLDVQDGIIVDAYGRTSDPSIYAVGDVARHYNPVLGRTIRVESWHNAQHQSAAVARVIAGAKTPYAEVPWFWSDQFDMNLQTVGYCSDWDRVVVRGDPNGRRFSALYLQGNRLVAANLVNNGREMPQAQRLIASQAALDVASLAQVERLDQAVISASNPADSSV
ncbi:MAG TPA: FAD-dependent oxidoreductase [Bordetella sp.]